MERSCWIGYGAGTISLTEILGHLSGTTVLFFSLTHVVIVILPKNLALTKPDRLTQCFMVENQTFLELVFWILFIATVFTKYYY